MASLTKVPEDERSDSPRSINFSRPISPQQTLPSSKPVTSARGGHSGWFSGPVINADQSFRGAKPRPKTSDGLSGFDVQSAQQAVQNAADRPVSTKKVQLSHGVEGARLATGSMRAKPTGSAVHTGHSHTVSSAHSERPRTVDPNSPYAIYDPSTRTFIHKQDAMALHRALNDAEDEPVPSYDAPHAVSPRHQAVPQQRKTEDHPSHMQTVAQRPPSPPRSDLQPGIPSKHEDHEAVPLPVSATPPSAAEARPPTPPASHPVGGAILERRTSEDLADNDIRPVVDANTSRKLQSPKPGEADPSLGTPHPPEPAPNQDSPYPRLPSPSKFTTAEALKPQRQGSVRSERTQSLSPPRNAHFAPVTVELPSGVKHQPPPRSVSPAKSALKPSASVSGRTSSPVANDGRGLSQGVSEASDAPLDDASKKRRKHVRVSFDEDPVIAGTSAYAEAETPTSPTGLSASRWSSTNEDRDLDDFMKPRPALPSFGSIRDKNRRAREGETPEKVTETVSSSLSTSVASTSTPMEISSDHAIGGILVQDFATKQTNRPVSQEPLPPEVTSVEGSGYASDSDQSDSWEKEPTMQTLDRPEAPVQPTRSTPEPEPKTLTTEVESRSPAPDVPIIAVQPASPSPVEHPEPKFQRPFVPGGWDEDEGFERRADEKRIPEAQPASDAVLPTNIEVPTSSIAEDTSSDDDSSIYSDAYEDLSETEDGGFGSIDAVVQSSVVSPPTGLMSSKYADVGAVESQKSEAQHENGDAITGGQESRTSDEWNAARQHWSNVTLSQKQHNPSESHTEPPLATESDLVPVNEASIMQAEASTESDAINEHVAPRSKTAKSPESMQAPAQIRKSAMKQSSSAQPAPSSSGSQLRTTMRERSTPSKRAPPTSPEPRLRKSMRDPVGGIAASSTEPQLRKTLRTADTAGVNRAATGLAASRHSMPAPATKPPKGALQKRNIPAAAASTAAKPRPTSAPAPARATPVAPTPAYDSDSDASASSFQRQRPRSTRKVGGRYTMRASMRSGPTPTIRATPTMRPMSPPQATSPPPTLRKSMRPTAEAPSSPGLRSSKFSIRSLSPAGRFRPKSSLEAAPPVPTQTSSPKRISAKISAFGKSSKLKDPPADAARSRFKSRFADSSDEDEDYHPKRFQSRFADSDDEEDFELPLGLAPVRGIPRRPGEEDRESTDLEDEASDTEPSPATGTNDVENGHSAAANGVTNGQGTNFTAGSLRMSKHATGLPTIEAGKKAKSKRAFFGLGKKKAQSSYIPDSDTDSRNGVSTDIPIPPEHRNREQNRPLTPIGEDKGIEAGEATTRSPKLQRRSTPQWGRSTSDSWPLPQPPKVGEEQRPQSSNGVAHRRVSLRPTLSKRYPSHDSEPRTTIEPTTGKEVILGRTGKKKKFQGLRRVFGLND